METDKVADIGFYVFRDIFSLGSEENIKAYISHKSNIYGRILFTLADYLTKYSEKIDRVSFHFTDQVNSLFTNGRHNNRTIGKKLFPYRISPKHSSPLLPHHI